MEEVKEKEIIQDAPQEKIAQEVTDTAQYTAIGRRKVSRARVRLVSGKGKIVVNGRPLEKYFTREVHQIVVRQPLKTAKIVGKFDIYINADGGGITGQAEAARHGIARALIKSDPTLRPILKKEKFLTRDPRVKERKKYGRKRARRRFQYTKR